MFGLGFGEIIVILVIALIFVGPDKLPDVARTLGKTVAELRRALDDIKFEMAAPRKELESEFRAARDAAKSELLPMQPLTPLLPDGSESLAPNALAAETEDAAGTRSNDVTEPSTPTVDAAPTVNKAEGVADGKASTERTTHGS